MNWYKKAQSNFPSWFSREMMRYTDNYSKPLPDNFRHTAEILKKWAEATNPNLENISIEDAIPKAENWFFSNLLKEDPTDPHLGIKNFSTLLEPETKQNIANTLEKYYEDRYGLSKTYVDPKTLVVSSSFKKFEAPQILDIMKQTEYQDGWDRPINFVYLISVSHDFPEEASRIKHPKKKYPYKRTELQLLTTSGKDFMVWEPNLGRTGVFYY